MLYNVKTVLFSSPTCQIMLDTFLFKINAENNYIWQLCCTILCIVDIYTLITMLYNRNNYTMYMTCSGCTTLGSGWNMSSDCKFSFHNVHLSGNMMVKLNIAQHYNHIWLPERYILFIL